MIHAIVRYLQGKSVGTGRGTVAQTGIRGAVTLSRARKLQAVSRRVRFLLPGGGMAISDIHLGVMSPVMIHDLARDRHAVLKAPARVFWTPRRGGFGWSRPQVSATLAKARIYLKDVLRIELDVRESPVQRPPLSVFFRNDAHQTQLQQVTSHFHPTRDGPLRIYFIDFIQTTDLGITQIGRNVVLMNGQLLLAPFSSGLSSFGDGSSAGITLAHEIAHSLDLRHIANPDYLMARRIRQVRLDVREQDYYLARLYGLIHRRLTRP